MAKIVLTYYVKRTSMAKIVLTSLRKIVFFYMAIFLIMSYRYAVKISHISVFFDTDQCQVIRKE